MNTNIFYLDFNSWLGIVILLLIIALSLFLFFTRNYGVSGLLLVFLGLMLVFNNVNVLIALIPFIFGVVITFKEG